KKTKVPENMIKRGIVGLSEFIKPMEDLLNQMKPPETGWSDEQIRFLLQILAQMDSNNDPASFRIGEREARISTPLLYDLSGGFIHGIGRSGDIKAAQPKAAGASIINTLTDSMVSFFIKEMGLKNIKGSIVVPLSTGMSLMLTIRGLFNKSKKDAEENGTEFLKNEIIFPRMDHKSPIKALELTGMNNITVDSIIGSDYIPSLESNDKKIEFIRKYGLDAVYIPVEKIEEKITEKTFGILSTTAYFPPRAPDNIKEISKIAKKYNLIHVINNAYGVQSTDLMKLIRSAIDAGRVDAIVQSTDKNFLTPVGGAIISSPYSENLIEISKAYAGRGSSAPIIHLFVSMLSMGLQGYMKLIRTQVENKKLLTNELKKIADELGEVILDVNNPIACIMTLNNFKSEQIEKLGGYLYNLRVTGPRVINPKEKNFGASSNYFPHAYLVMNSAIGVKKDDILGAVNQLTKALAQIK
ncbi:MAG: O-phosphoseryl-tRNA(Sec) selenium transferase, partial [archaeon]|nr:O-phosphoseryl-tRNA(Sec) selenium transferase [archaeon]